MPTALAVAAGLRQIPTNHYHVDTDMTDKLLACKSCGSVNFECCACAADANFNNSITNFALVAITTAYEQGVGKGRECFRTKRVIGNPYAVDDVYRTYGAWALGFDEGVAQAERAAQQPDAKVENTGSHTWKLRQALQRAHDWMDSQANASMYKVSFTELARERDAIAEALK